MKFSTLASAVILTATTSSVALADCKLSDATFKNEIAAGDMRQNHFRAVLRDMRELRAAAATLGKYDKNAACEAIIAAMRDITSNPPQNVALRSVTKLGGKLKVNEIIDAELRSVNNEYLGYVSDIIVDATGTPGFVVVEFGGFLGIGEEQAVIPFKTLQVSPDQEAFFVPLTQEQFEKAPRFDSSSVNWASDQSWKKGVEEYYGTRSASANDASSQNN